MRKRLLAVVVLAMLMLAVVGCSSTGDGSSSSADANIDPAYAQAFEYVETFEEGELAREIASTISSGIELFDIDSGEQYDKDALFDHYYKLQDLLETVPANEEIPEKAVTYFDAYRLYVDRESVAFWCIASAQVLFEDNEIESSNKYVEDGKECFQEAIEALDEMDAIKHELYINGTAEGQKLAAEGDTASESSSKKSD